MTFFLTGWVESSATMSSETAATSKKLKRHEIKLSEIAKRTTSPSSRIHCSFQSTPFTSKKLPLFFLLKKSFKKRKNSPRNLGRFYGEIAKVKCFSKLASISFALQWNFFLPIFFPPLLFSRSLFPILLGEKPLFSSQ